MGGSGPATPGAGTPPGPGTPGPGTPGRAAQGRAALTERSGKGVVRWPERAVRRLLRLVGLEGLVHIAFRALRDEGWLRSYRRRVPLTRSGQPLPWYTYP